MALAFESPYADTSGRWLRGNLHTHTTNTDGRLSPEEAVEVYRELEYDWIALTDHDLVTPKPATLSESMVFLSGNEITAGGPHLLHVGTEARVEPDPDRAAAVAKVVEAGGLCVLNHPNWGKDCVHWEQSDLERIPDYDGIEIYNGVVRALPGSPLATDRWDLLLSAGRRVWGYANDDAHWRENFGLAWNVACCEERSSTEILRGLKSGRFYASTGVRLSTLETEGSRIRIVSENGDACVVVRDHGAEVGRYSGRAWEFDLEDLATERQPSYLRFEILGGGGAVAWTQPIFLQRN